MVFNETLPIAPITVEEIKAHLRIDDDSEDTLISQYILTATQDAEQRMQREVIFRNDSKALAKTIADVPPIIKQYIMCYVGDMYAHRELTDLSNYKTFYEHLLDPFVLYIRDDLVEE